MTIKYYWLLQFCDHVNDIVGQKKFNTYQEAMNESNGEQPIYLVRQTGKGVKTRALVSWEHSLATNKHPSLPRRFDQLTDRKGYLLRAHVVPNKFNREIAKYHDRTGN